jgi:hypothetical protein
MFNSGFIPSVIDGTENEFVEPKNKGLLKEYSYKKYLPDVLNQGTDSICVPCSLSANINWRLNLDHGKIIDNKEVIPDHEKGVSGFAKELIDSVDASWSANGNYLQVEKVDAKQAEKLEEAAEKVEKNSENSEKESE